MIKFVVFLFGLIRRAFARYGGEPREQTSPSCRGGRVLYQSCCRNFGWWRMVSA